MKEQSRDHELPKRRATKPTGRHRLGESTPKKLEKAIDQCMLDEQPALRRRLRTCTKLPQAVRVKRLVQLAKDIEVSHARLVRRLDALPRPQLPHDLPITEKKSAIEHALEHHQVIIVCGETGSGKTTQLPKICLGLGRGVSGMIGHTQPRRIAARSVATRIAEELETTLGETVGYKVRFSERVHHSAYIKLMTDGILLSEIHQDRLLLQYDTLIIDEAHERSLNIDFILGYLKRILPKRSELKIIITSATIDPDSFARHFDGAPVIEVSGRGYPVDIRYQPLIAEDQEERELQQGILDAVSELSRLERGDILVFLPGEREIRETAESLRKHHPQGTEILPLYARLSVSEQNRVFLPHKHQRIVIATNVAETSLTVPGIKYVIDTGLARISRYSIRSKVQRLPIEGVSQASAKQRAGRCGRTSPGVCIRLYSAQDYTERPPFTDPEIQRTNLASVILQMNHLNLGEVETFPFMAPPDTRLINDGYRLLKELNAMDSHKRLTPLGKKLARLPVDPRLARILIAAEPLKCLREILIIVSALAAQDPRERPMEQREAADEKHKQFQDEQSDFLGLVRLWEFLHKQQQHLSKTKFRKLCRQYFLSVTRVFEWQDIHGQLRSMLSGDKMRVNQKSADYEAVHRALISGLLSHIGVKDTEREFRGARNRTFSIFPGSSLYRKAPNWVIAAELTETTRLYARTVAKINPKWVVVAAPHLIKREYFEPHWNSRNARVVAYERITLYGLVLVARQRVNYGPINPVESREIFIRHGLIAGQYHTSAEFYHHNLELITKLKVLEAKARRRDILVTEEYLYDFYNAQIPTRVYDGKSFETWLKTHPNQADLLLTRDRLIRTDSKPVDDRQLPDHLDIAGTSLPLTYLFDPGDSADGVTLTVPLPLLNQINPAVCEWLVPGLLHEKVVALIKSLPKHLRKHFVPAPEFARACVEAMVPYRRSLLRSLSHELLRMTGTKLSEDNWSLEALSDHLRMRFNVVNAEGNTIRTGRDLRQLQNALSGNISQRFQGLTSDARHSERFEDWEFGSLVENVEMEQSGVKFLAYPALIDKGTHVTLEFLDTTEKARSASHLGILRLYLLRLRDQVKYLQKHLPGISKLCLQYQSLGTCESLKSEIIETAFERVFLSSESLPSSRNEFYNKLDTEKNRLITTANDICRLTGEILAHYHAVRHRLPKKIPMSWTASTDDIRQQLACLIYPGFVRETPPQWFEQLPRFLQAVSIRLDKLEHSPIKVQKAYTVLQPWWEKYTAYIDAQQRQVVNEKALNHYRWMLEELRVSLFAQTLGTSIPVSAKRLERQWEKVVIDSD